MNLKIKPTGTPAPTPEKQPEVVTPVITPEGENPSLGEEVAAMDAILADAPPEVKADEEKVIVPYAAPARGVRFRFKKNEYVLGELDSVAEVNKWVTKNEVDPSKVEILNAEGVWVCFDKAAK